MEIRSLKFVADACGGELVKGSPQTPVYRVCTDSRAAQSGDLFMALTGERFDGHDFLSEVVQKGVAAVTVERSKMSADGHSALRTPNSALCGVITVDNSRQALGRLAARYRN